MPNSDVVTWLARVSCVLAVVLAGCPAGQAGVDALPPCRPSLGHDDCTGDALPYCLPLADDGTGANGRCVACRNFEDCQDGNPCNGRERCDGFLGCMPGEPVVCEQPCQVCNPSDGLCELGPDVDRDRDGADSPSCGGTDCDDTDPERAPGIPEVCDGEDRDEDCDPTTFGDRDADRDGHVDERCSNVSVEGRRYSGDDCDDSRGSAHPGLAEVCDGYDNDCDAATDEGVVAIAYIDADGDGFGVGRARDACNGADGFAFQDGDCDDGRANIHPGAFRCAGGGGSGIDLCDDGGSWRESTCPGDGQCVSQPDGTGVCWPGSLSECADGSDNDGDGVIDASDPDCASPADVSESPERCNDGVDNDSDNFTDYPNDPGCESRFDATEKDPTTPPVCANGLDDDGDGTADYLLGTGDRGCSSAADDSERNPSGPRCDNGVNDDGDKAADFPSDPECTGPLDDNEDTPACGNGIDDDGDGRIDYVPASNFYDPGCTDVQDESERGVAPGAPVCDNALDDDGDGAADFPGDLGCTNPADSTE